MNNGINKAELHETIRRAVTAYRDSKTALHGSLVAVCEYTAMSGDMEEIEFMFNEMGSRSKYARLMAQFVRRHTDAKFGLKINKDGRFSAFKAKGWVDSILDALPNMAKDDPFEQGRVERAPRTAEQVVQAMVKKLTGEDYGLTGEQIRALVAEATK